jgi:hypothetical protein
MKNRHQVHAGMSYRSISEEVMVSVQSQAKIYASHAVKYPRSRALSSVHEVPGGLDWSLCD